MSTITLITDFGEKDGYPGVMKGVMLGYDPDIRFVDITHSVRPFGIKEAAFILKSTYPYFPKGTIHLVVVDPGVGGKRAPLIVESDGHWFVGPDNGVFSYIYDKRAKVYEIVIEKLKVGSISSTFHGRDVFSVVAGFLSQDRRIEEFAEPFDGFVSLPFPKTEKAKGVVYGEVVYVDKFGNLITNIEEKEIRGQGYFETGEKRISIQSSYEKVEKERPLAILGSSGYYELSIREGRADKFLRLDIGDKIKYVEKRSLKKLQTCPPRKALAGGEPRDDKKRAT